MQASAKEFNRIKWTLTGVYSGLRHCVASLSCANALHRLSISIRNVHERVSQRWPSSATKRHTNYIAKLFAKTIVDEKLPVRQTYSRHVTHTHMYCSRNYLQLIIAFCVWNIRAERIIVTLSMDYKCTRVAHSLPLRSGAFSEDTDPHFERHRIKPWNFL